MSLALSSSMQALQETTAYAFFSGFAHKQISFRCREKMGENCLHDPPDMSAALQSRSFRSSPTHASSPPRSASSSPPCLSPSRSSSTGDVMQVWRPSVSASFPLARPSSRLRPTHHGFFSAFSFSLVCRRRRRRSAGFLLCLAFLFLPSLSALARIPRPSPAFLSRPAFPLLSPSSSFVFGPSEAFLDSGVYTPWHTVAGQHSWPPQRGDSTSPPPRVPLSSRLSLFSALALEPSFFSPFVALPSPSLSSFASSSSLCSSSAPCSSFPCSSLPFRTSSSSSLSPSSSFSRGCSFRCELPPPGVSLSSDLLSRDGACSSRERTSSGGDTTLRAFTIFVNPDTAPKNKDAIANTYSRMCVAEGHVRRIRENQRRVKRVTRGEGGSFLVLKRRRQLYWARRHAREVEKKVDWAAVAQLRCGQLKRLMEALDSNAALEARRQREAHKQRGDATADSEDRRTER
ncbi:hypothetical protein TGGT1_248860 [Toxoplasma gondii GT1]|uniref:Transmembrane protein n=4 Tax=Toxoplasma gondii TaxID=5811 RepID=S7V0H7_TOXGG|nr:hypothetical protein TGGT1_248860 [Toxoplasma gondii GT1]KAF4638665.1 hypothetical protein TGRH88_062730 [Toxoplasma gondii]RQX72176.1 putative transmembrane protein [Toxoplasma gondii CAST]